MAQISLFVDDIATLTSIVNSNGKTMGLYLQIKREADRHGLIDLYKRFSP